MPIRVPTKRGYIYCILILLLLVFKRLYLKVLVGMDFFLGNLILLLTFRNGQ